MIAVIPRERAFDRDAVLLGADHHRLRQQCLLGAVEILHEGFDAALIHHLLSLHLRMPGVGEDNAHAGIQKGEFAQPVLQRRIVELDVSEGLRARHEAHHGAAAAFRRRSDHGERGFRVAIAEAHLEFLALAPDHEVERGGERIHHRDADAVQAAGDLVGILVELTAGVQLGHDDLGRRDALLGVDVGRNAAAIVGHGDRAFRVQRHRHFGGVAGERLVNGIVHHLIDHVVEA